MPVTNQRLNSFILVILNAIYRSKINILMKFLVFFIMVGMQLGVRHPFYLSVTELKYDIKEKALQGSVRIFVNDLETSLKKSYGKTIDLIHEKDSALTKSILSSYLKIILNSKSTESKKPSSFLVSKPRRKLFGCMWFLKNVRCQKR